MIRPIFLQWFTARPGKDQSAWKLIPARIDQPGNQIGRAAGRERELPAVNKQNDPANIPAMVYSQTGKGSMNQEADPGPKRLDRERALCPSCNLFRSSRVKQTE